MVIDLSRGVWPTTFTSHLGHHPAITQGNSVWYWPDEVYGVEDVAYESACFHFAKMQDAAQAVARDWATTLVVRK